MFGWVLSSAERAGPSALRACGGCGAHQPGAGPSQHTWTAPLCHVHLPRHLLLAEPQTPRQCFRSCHCSWCLCSPALLNSPPPPPAAVGSVVGVPGRPCRKSHLPTGPLYCSGFDRTLPSEGDLSEMCCEEKRAVLVRDGGTPFLSWGMGFHQREGWRVGSDLGYRSALRSSLEEAQRAVGHYPDPRLHWAPCVEVPSRACTAGSVSRRTPHELTRALNIFKYRTV